MSLDEPLSEEVDSLLGDSLVVLDEDEPDSDEPDESELEEGRLSLR
ncbi:hypothetical protein [Candidatus Poriferisodalis sp.]